MELGQVVATRTIADAMKDNFEFRLFTAQCFERYSVYDFGDLCDEDKRENDIALKHGYRVFASYDIPEGILTGDYDNKIWIITEADRSATTVLFPSEY